MRIGRELFSTASAALSLFSLKWPNRKAERDTRGIRREGFRPLSTMTLEIISYGDEYGHSAAIPFMPLSSAMAEAISTVAPPMDIPTRKTGAPFFLSLA